jgi:ribosomal protein L29
MAAIRKSELKKMTPAERKSKIAELERAMLELQGEGRVDKTRPLRKAIAKLKTPPHVPSVSQNIKKP